MQLVELLKMTLSEVSGVDQPANMLDGFLVMKSAGVADNSLAEAYFKAAAQMPVASNNELRRTLAPVYSADRVDFHGEHASAAELENAAFDFNKRGPHPLHLQHNDFGNVKIGEINALFPWAYDMTVPLTKADGTTRKVTLPAGSLYAWCTWNEPAWQLIKAGKIQGLSFGGRAMRRPSTAKGLLPMGDTVAVGKSTTAGEMRKLLAEIEADYDATGADNVVKMHDGSFFVSDVEKQCVLHVHAGGIDILEAAPAN
jgi:hypothetical protein